MKHEREQERAIIVEDQIDYKAVVSLINEGVIIMQEGRIVFANQAFARMVGMSVLEILGSPFKEFVSPIHTKAVQECIDGIGRQFGQEDRMEFQLNKEAGRIVDMKVSVISLGGKNAILGALSDITETRKKTLETQRLHSRLRSIIDSMRHVVLSFSYRQEADAGGGKKRRLL